MTAAPPPTGDPDRPEQDPPRSARADAAGLLDDAYTQFRTFDRAREGRMVAGVCAGVGRRLGIDPVVVRIVVAVLALVSGAGLVLYGAAWLLLPEEGSQQSIAERLLGRRGGEPNSAIMVGIGAIAAIIATGMLPWGVDWWGPVLVALIIGGLVALARRRPGESSADPLGYLGGPGDLTAASAPTEQRATPRESTPAEPTSVGATSPATPADTAGATNQVSIPAEDQPVTGTEPTQPAREPESAAPAGPTPSAPPRTWTQHAATPPPPSFWDQPDPLGLESDPEPEPYAPPAPAPAPAKAIERPRSALFPITIGAALLSVLVLAAASGAGEPVPMMFWAAAPLGIIGLGLLVGTWYGRSGGLIALGIPLAIALVPLGVVDTVAKGGYWPQSDAEFGDALYAPTSTADLEPAYRHGVGDLTVDLREVDFSDRNAVEVSIEAGVGDLTVILPASGVDVTATGSVGLGDASVFGRSGRSDNVDSAPVFELRDEGTDGPGGGQLTIDATLGLGSLEIARDTPTRPTDIPRPDPPNPPRVEEPEAPR